MNVLKVSVLVIQALYLLGIESIQKKKHYLTDNYFSIIKENTDLFF